MTTLPELHLETAIRRTLPAWVASVAAHCFLMVSLGLLATRAPRGSPADTLRPGEIVLVQTAAGKTDYSTGNEHAAASSANTTGSPSANALSLPLPGPAEAPLRAETFLPTAADLAQTGDLAGKLPGANGFSTTARPGRKLGDSRVETGIFGVTGTGTKFVYVIDRSGSMAGFQGRPLAAAKSELVASLQKLDKIHQFQIVFYNERPKVFNPYPGQTPRLMFGDESSKQAAEQFVRGIDAQGGTRHMDALRLALGFTPDVIFFLTDAEEPRLTPSDLEQLRRSNRSGAAINAIEFGAGAFRGENFLVQLARQNSGKHVYVDVAKLPLRQ